MKLEYKLELLGKIKAKKNAYLPRHGRLIKSAALREELGRLAMQIPPELRDLKLRHPDMDIRIWTPEGRSDRDNMLTSVLDLLKQYGVIVNDSIAQFNGHVNIYPAQLAEYWRAVITLRVNQANGWPPR